MSVSREVLDSVLTLCHDISTPRSLTVKLMVENGEWDQLVQLRTDPMRYSCAESYFRDNQVTEILRKHEKLETSIDRKAVACQGFLRNEAACYSSNLRLSRYVNADRFHQLTDAERRINSFLGLVRKEIARILGKCPDLKDGRFGPGATYGDRGQWTTVPDKMSSKPTLTHSAKYFTLPWMGTAWAAACRHYDRGLVYVKGNRFTTVPKDATKDRGIAIEPSLNLFYQLAYGSAMKDRIKRAGIDLLCASDNHRELARVASLSGELCTLDLSDASDTVCKRLVELLLPADWFDVLNALRSSHTLFEGKWVLLEKFSSMGNGFTFELETLIFLAISIVCTREAGFDPILGVNVSVFGDDIIVPTAAYSNVKSMLSFLGFTLNAKKSFATGWFRESCGGDFFKGVSVRAHYQKENTDEPQQHIAMANGLRRSASFTDQSGFDRRYMLRTWFRSLDRLPSEIKSLRGPQVLGDICIHDDEPKWVRRSRSSIHYVRVFRPARFPRLGWEHWSPEVVLAAALYGVGDGLSKSASSAPSKERRDSGGVIPRGAVAGYKVGWVPFS